MRNLASSIKDRLLNLSRSSGGDFQMLLERFAMGRLLWRLVHSERTFVLKGAQLFSIWQGTPHRPTRDLDLLSSTLSFGTVFIGEQRRACLFGGSTPQCLLAVSFAEANF